MEVQNQDKQIMLYKATANIGIKKNKEANKTKKTSSKYAKNYHNKTTSEWQREWENSTSKLYYIKVPTTVVGIMSLS